LLASKNVSQFGLAVWPAIIPNMGEEFYYIDVNGINHKNQYVTLEPNFSLHFITNIKV